MIDVENICVAFGGLKAVNNVSLHLETGRITGLIGPNGAGKTTLFNVIAGALAPTSGRVVLQGEDITNLEPHERFARGLLRTFQIAHEFPSLTVLENLMLVPPHQIGETLLRTWIDRQGIRKQEAEISERAHDVLDFLNIRSLAHEAAGNLSGGQKKLLELGRTMMVDAQVVLLDEVGAGVNRTLLKTIGDAILRLNQERGYTFCMIEHDVDFITRMCDDVIVMAEGSELARGNMAEIRKNEAVINAYLGRAA